jgi:hypothetical protein
MGVAYAREKKFASSSGFLRRDRYVHVGIDGTAYFSVAFSPEILPGDSYRAYSSILPGGRGKTLFRSLETSV